MYNCSMKFRVFPRYVFVLLLAAFITVNLFGAASGMGMQTNAQGKMTGCMFSGTAICTMTPFEHLAAWQNMFTAAASQTDSTLLLLLLTALTFLGFATARRLFDDRLDLLESHQKLYVKRLVAHSYINPLQEAFSQGILNPKLY